MKQIKNSNPVQLNDIPLSIVCVVKVVGQKVKRITCLQVNRYMTNGYET